MTTQGRKYDLIQIPFIKLMLRSRWPQFLLTTMALIGFILAILSGLFGTPVGSRNFGIIFVWIVWWAILILVAVPFLGRGWCSICPIPAAGEWLQRGAILNPPEQTGSDVSERGFGLRRRWPRALRNIWLQNVIFVMVALFSAVVLTQSLITAIALIALLFVSVGASLIFERRAFCRYLCPVSGFIGLYAQLAPVEVRVKDTRICASHTRKTCYTGNAEGYGCPWQVFPGGLVKNTNCGLCMECLRTCPYDNIALNLRAFGTELARPTGRKMDEAFKALIMLGSVLIYSAVYLGPWGALKTTASAVGSVSWLAYALTFLTFVLALLPGLFFLAVSMGKYLSNSKVQVRKSFIAFAYALIPLGLMAWIAFSLSFVFANLSYIWPVLSDPFGWGWDLFGTAGVAWMPLLTRVVPALQTFILLVGLVWSSLTVRRIASEWLRPRMVNLHSIPVVFFCFAVTLGMLRLLIG